MKKRICVFILSPSVLFSCAVPAMAVSNNTNDEAYFEVDEETFDINTGVTRDNYVVVDQLLTSTTGSQTISFNPNSNYPYYRIYILNDSDSTYNITLTDANGVNQLVSSPIRLSPGYQSIVRNNVAASGIRYLTITSTDGSTLEGSVSIRIASNADELA